MQNNPNNYLELNENNEKLKIKSLKYNNSYRNMHSLNTCQCCLAEGCTKDIFSEYYCNGQKEVYSDLLLNTLNVNVQGNSSKKICEQCISDLRRATEFKMKVLNARSCIERENKLKLEDADFEDKLSVKFDYGNFAVENDMNNKGQIFMIQLVSRSDFADDDRKSPFKESDDSMEIENDTDAKEFDQSLGESDEINVYHLGKNTMKSQQPESRSQKDSKENSLHLIFNSNLCLFKSLKTKFGCFICKEAFFTIKELRQHTNVHSNVELIRLKFNRLRGLSYHNADISSLKCSQCEQACFDLTELKKHLIEKHGVHFGDVEHFLIPYKLEDSFDCVVCNEKFNTYMTLSIHMNQHYSNNVCEICGHSFINRISLRIHLQSRHREKKCSLCSESFLTNYARVRHMRTHHNSCLSKRYCLICGKTFRYTYQLSEHKIQEHGAKRQFSKCHLCPKTFPNTQNLKIHVRSVHVRERNFPCNLCEMRFFTNFDKKRHEKTHMDVRSFGCSFCESRFKGKDSLRRHLKRQHGNVAT